jgi:hypothetical protein
MLQSFVICSKFPGWFMILDSLNEDRLAHFVGGAVETMSFSTSIADLLGCRSRAIISPELDNVV